MGVYYWVCARCTRGANLPVTHHLWSLDDSNACTSVCLNWSSLLANLSPQCRAVSLGLWWCLWVALSLFLSAPSVSPAAQGASAQPRGAGRCLATPGLSRRGRPGSTQPPDALRAGAPLPLSTPGDGTSVRTTPVSTWK